MTLEVRKLADPELPAVVALVNEINRASYEYVPYTIDTIGLRLRQGRLLVVVAAEHATIIGSAALNHSHWGEEVEWLAAAVGERRVLVEDQLVSGLEQLARDQRISARLDSASPRIEEWGPRGYVPEGGLYHAAAPLTNRMPVPAGAGVIFRSLRPEEADRFVEVVNEGYGWERVKAADVERWKLDDPPFDESWVQVAEVGGKLVSVLVARPDTDFNRAFNGRRGYLGPASTVAEYRNRKLAFALAARAVNALLDRGMDSVALHIYETNAAPLAMIRNLGLHVTHHWKFVRKTLARLALIEGE